MKTMFVATALIVGMTLPAVAQSCENTVSRASYSVARNYTGAYASYASHSTKRSATRRHVSRSRSVYSTRGKYIGSDPDPRVRDQLRRDPSQGGNNL
jgi:Tfp pilus tip-associated adhesin PilY1